MNSIRSTFSGSFYPENKNILDKVMESFFANCDKTISKAKGLIVPHAGYIYSGQVAAFGYKQLSNEKIKTAIVLGSSHQIYSDIAAIPREDSYITPYGKIMFDLDIINKLVSEKQIQLNSQPHYQEHSLEVQFPFLQYLNPNMLIVPISVGAMSFNKLSQIAGLLREVLDEKTILIISTDLSHFHSLSIANELDQRTITTMLSMDAKALFDGYNHQQVELCGIFPVVVALETLKQNTFAKLLRYDTSATATQYASRVVGYTSIALIDS